MSRDQYLKVLPTGSLFQLVIDWVRNYVGYEFEWHLQLVLKRDEVPSARLGSFAQLGWTSWIGGATKSLDADDLVLAPEKIVNGPGCGARSAQMQSAFA
jgi:type VI secretion system protein ImpH